MKYVLLLFVGLALTSCGVSRSSGHLRKVKVDRTMKEVETKEPRIRDWDAIFGEDAGESVRESAENGADEPDFDSVQSSVKEESNVAISEGTIETQRSDTEMIVSANVQEVNSDKESGSYRKTKRSSQRSAARPGGLKVSVFLGIIVFCVLLACLIVFFPSIWSVLKIVLLVLAILVVYFLFFGPMVYE